MQQQNPQMSPAQGMSPHHGGSNQPSPHSMHSGQPSPQSFPVTSPGPHHGRPGITSPMGMPSTSPSPGGMTAMSPMNPPSQSPQPSMSPQHFPQQPHGGGGHFSGSQSPANSISQSPRHVSRTQSGNFMIFLLFRFYVKSTFENLEVLKLPFWILWSSEYC